MTRTRRARRRRLRTLGTTAAGRPAEGLCVCFHRPVLYNTHHKHTSDWTCPLFRLSLFVSVKNKSIKIFWMSLSMMEIFNITV